MPGIAVHHGRNTHLDLPQVKEVTQSASSSAFKSVSLRFGGKRPLSVSVNREQYDDKVAVVYEDGAQPQLLARFLRLCHEHFPEFSQASAISRALGPELAEFYSVREQGLLRLEGLTQRLIEENQEHRRKLDEDTEELKKSLHTQATQVEADLRQAYDVRRTELDQRAETLAAREKELDDRSARHARRESIKGLKSIIAGRAKSFSLTKETQRKRWPIHAIFISLLVVSAGVVALGLFHQPAANLPAPALWLQLLRVPLGAAGFILSSVFYIRWNDNWFRRHADEEFRLRGLELDVDRASWVTELALEFRDEKGEVPPELIERLSAGLFTASASDPVRHPSQDLLSAILSASSALRLKLPGGIEADLNRGAVKRLQKDLEV